MTAWRMVPEVPTDAMMRAVSNLAIRLNRPDRDVPITDGYIVMLAAAPKPPPHEPSDAEVEAAAREIGRVLEETQGEGTVFNPRENDFDWRPELRVMARAALVAADEVRQEGK